MYQTIKFNLEQIISSVKISSTADAQLCALNLLLLSNTLKYAPFLIDTDPVCNLIDQAITELTQNPLSLTWKELIQKSQVKIPERTLVDLVVKNDQSKQLIVSNQLSISTFKRTLIKGPSGIGKTTLVYHACLQKLSQNINQSADEMVFILPLSKLTATRYSSEVGLEEILAREIFTECTETSWAHMLAQSVRSGKTQIILDDYDEMALYWQELQKEHPNHPLFSILPELFALPNCVVLARDLSLHQLETCWSFINTTQLTLKGIDSEHVMKHMRSLFFNTINVNREPDLANQLFQSLYDYLASHDYILEQCRNPLIARLLVTVYAYPNLESRQDTLTELFLSMLVELTRNAYHEIIKLGHERKRAFYKPYHRAFISDIDPVLMDWFPNTNFSDPYFKEFYKRRDILQSYNALFQILGELALSELTSPSADRQLHQLLEAEEEVSQEMFVKIVGKLGLLKTQDHHPHLNQRYIFAHTQWRDFFAAFALAKKLVKAPLTHSQLHVLQQSARDKNSLLIRFLAGLLNPQGIIRISQNKQELQLAAQQLYDYFSNDPFKIAEICLERHESADLTADMKQQLSENIQDMMSQELAEKESLQFWHVHLWVLDQLPELHSWIISRLDNEQYFIPMLKRLIDLNWANEKIIEHLLHHSGKQLTRSTQSLLGTLFRQLFDLCHNDLNYVLFAPLWQLNHPESILVTLLEACRHESSLMPMPLIVDELMVLYQIAVISDETLTLKIRESAIKSATQDILNHIRYLHFSSISTHAVQQRWSTSERIFMLKRLQENAASENLPDELNSADRKKLIKITRMALSDLLEKIKVDYLFLFEAPILQSIKDLLHKGDNELTLTSEEIPNEINPNQFFYSSREQKTQGDKNNKLEQNLISQSLGSVHLSKTEKGTGLN